MNNKSVVRGSLRSACASSVPVPSGKCMALIIKSGTLSLMPDNADRVSG